MMQSHILLLLLLSISIELFVDVSLEINVSFLEEEKAFIMSIRINVNMPI